MENNLWKRFLIERKKRSYEQFQDKIFKNCMQSALGSVFVDFCVRISSKIADLFYAVCGGNDFAMIANPMVKFLEKRIKINRKYGSVIMIVLVIGLVVLVCYGAGAVLAKGIGAFMAYLPTMSANAGTEFSEAINQSAAAGKTAIYAECGFKRHRNCDSGFFDKFCVQLRFCNAWGNRRICQKPAGYDRWHSRRTACSIFFYCR